MLKDFQKKTCKLRPDLENWNSLSFFINTFIVIFQFVVCFIIISVHVVSLWLWGYVSYIRCIYCLLLANQRSTRGVCFPSIVTFNSVAFSLAWLVDTVRVWMYIQFMFVCVCKRTDTPICPYPPPFRQVRQPRHNALGCVLLWEISGHCEPGIV